MGFWEFADRNSEAVLIGLVVVAFLGFFGGIMIFSLLDKALSCGMVH